MAILRAAMQAPSAANQQPWEFSVVANKEKLRAFAIFPYGYPAEEREQQDRFDESRIHYVE